MKSKTVNPVNPVNPVTGPDLLAFAGQPRQLRPVQLPAAGQTVCVRELDGLGLSALHRLVALVRAAEGDEPLSAGLYCGAVAAACLADSAGAALFADPDVATAQRLARLPGADLDAIFAAADDLNLLSPQKLEAAKQRFFAIPSCDSPLPLPGSAANPAPDASSPN